MNPYVHVVSHPLIDHSLTILRNKTTSTDVFRHHSAIVSQILFLEAAKQFAVKEKPIETPLAKAHGFALKEKIIVVPVLRAGLAMLDALENFIPFASVGFIGLARDEKTAQAKEYYQKLPKIFASHHVLLVDPMLATGGSMSESVAMLTAKGAKTITVICIVAAPEGIQKLTAAFPALPIYTAAIDKTLDSRKYIVPGLGDYGDRYFGTV